MRLIQTECQPFQVINVHEYRLERYGYSMEHSRYQPAPKVQSFMPTPSRQTKIFIWQWHTSVRVRMGYILVLIIYHVSTIHPRTSSMIPLILFRWQRSIPSPAFGRRTHNIHDYATLVLHHLIPLLWSHGDYA